MERIFTVEEMLQAAEQAKLPNYNGTYIDYSYDQAHGHDKPVVACVIGEAFINLGFVENGVDASSLSFALQGIPIDKPIFTKEVKLTPVYEKRWQHTIQPEHVSDLSGFINTLNSYRGYSGKKRMAKLVRKYFANSLGVRIRADDYGFEVIG